MVFFLDGEFNGDNTSFVKFLHDFRNSPDLSELYFNCISILYDQYCSYA